MNASTSQRIALQQLLCAIVTPKANIESDILIKPAQATNLIELANLNFMNFALYAGLQAKQLLKHFSNQEQAYLKDYFELNQQRNNEFINELQHIIQVLNKINIEPVLLKGAVALLDHWYEDRGERFLRDIDFLVPENQAQQAFECLQERGYTLVNPLDEKLHELKTHQLAALHKEGSPLVIEIHTSPVSLKAKSLLTAAMVFKNQVALNPESFKRFGSNNHDLLKCYIPSPEHCLLIAIIHTQIADNNYQKGMFFLRHGMDIQRILERYQFQSLNTLNALFKSQGFSTLLPDYLSTLDFFFNTSYSKKYKISSVDKNNKKLEKIINNLAQENTQKSTADIRKHYLKQQITKAFSKDSIVMRYGEVNAMTVNFYRSVNFFRLIIKYASPENRRKLKAYQDESLENKTSINDNGFLK